jgi:hypothetical protein
MEEFSPTVDVDHRVISSAFRPTTEEYPEWSPTISPRTRFRFNLHRSNGEVEIMCMTWRSMMVSYLARDATDQSGLARWFSFAKGQLTQWLYDQMEADGIKGAADRHPRVGPGFAQAQPLMEPDTRWITVEGLDGPIWVCGASRIPVFSGVFPMQRSRELYG